MATNLSKAGLSYHCCFSS